MEVPFAVVDYCSPSTVVQIYSHDHLIRRTTEAQYVAFENGFGNLNSLSEVELELPATSSWKTNRRMMDHCWNQYKYTPSTIKHVQNTEGISEKLQM